MKRFDFQVNDYVKWYAKGVNHEGWVYFVDEEYITIEIGVKPRPYCDRVRSILHCNDHLLLLCYNQFWDELEYIKTRKSIHETEEFFIRDVTYVDTPCNSR